MLVGGVGGGADDTGRVDDGLVFNRDAAVEVESCCEVADGKVLELGMMDLPVTTLFRSVEEVLGLLPLLTEVVVDDKSCGAKEHASSLAATSIPRFWLTGALHRLKAPIGTPLYITFGLSGPAREYASSVIR